DTADAGAPLALLGADLGAVEAARRVAIRRIALEAEVGLTRLAGAALVDKAGAGVVDAEVLLVARLDRPALGAAGVEGDIVGRVARVLTDDDLAARAAAARRVPAAGARHAGRAHAASPAGGAVVQPCGAPVRERDAAQGSEQGGH